MKKEELSMIRNTKHYFDNKGNAGKISLFILYCSLPIRILIFTVCLIFLGLGLFYLTPLFYRFIEISIITLIVIILLCIRYYNNIK